MPFDADKWLAERKTAAQTAAPPSFDADAWLAERGVGVAVAEQPTPQAQFEAAAWLEERQTAAQKSAPLRFDVDAWLAERKATSPSVTPEPLPGGVPATPATAAMYAKPPHPVSAAPAGQPSVAPPAAPPSPGAAPTSVLIDYWRTKYRQTGDVDDYVKWQEAIRLAETGAKTAIEQISTDTVEALLRKPYLAAKHFFSGATFGLGGAAFRAMEDRMGGRIEPQAVTEQIVGALAELIGGVATGRGVAANIAKLSRIRRLSLAKQVLSTRGIAALLQSGLNNLSQAATGDKTALQGLRDTAIGIGASIVGMIPEQTVTPGIKNWVSQVVVDLLYDWATDKMFTDRLKNRKFRDWLLTDEMPQLVMSVAFATEDLTDKNFAQRQAEVKADIRKMVQRRLGVKPESKPAVKTGAIKAFADLRSEQFPEVRKAGPTTPITETAGLPAERTRAATEPLPETSATAGGILAEAIDNGKLSRAKLNDLAKQVGVTPKGSNEKLAWKIAEARVKTSSDISSPRQEQDARFRKTTKTWTDLPQGRGKTLRLWTGQRHANNELQRATGVWLSDNQSTAKGYAGNDGRLHEVIVRADRDVPYDEALPALQSVISKRRGKWTDADVAAFNEYAKTYDIETGREAMDHDAEYAMQRNPDQTDVDKFMFLMPDALREMGHDPDVTLVSREYEVGGGMKDGTMEYVSFGKGQIKSAEVTPDSAGRIPPPSEWLLSSEPSPSGQPTEAATRTPDIRKTSPVESINRKARRKEQGGFISIGGTDDIQRPRPVLDWLRRHLSRTKGVASEVHDAWVRMEDQIAAGRLEGRFVATITDNIIKKTRGVFASDDAIRGDMVNVVRGDMTPVEFAGKYGLTQIDVADLDRIHKNNLRRQDMIARLPGLSDDARQSIKDAIYYQTRDYERWIMGDKFEVNPDDYRAAINLTRDEMANKLERFGLATTKATTSKKYGVMADAATYLATGDERIISGLSQTRQKAMRAIRKQFNKFKDMVDALDVDTEGNVSVIGNDEAIAKAAQEFVDYHLTKESTAGSPRGGVDVTNLRRRIMDEVWRKLYGEIQDPSYTSARTTEVQTRMLAQAAFFNKLAQDGENQWWHNRPAPGRYQLGNPTRRIDIMRYGDLAGKWVDKATYDLIHGPERSRGMTAKILDALYYKPQAVMRLAKLYGPKTIIRNWVTSYTGFALGSGDAFLPTYFKRAAEAHTLLRDYVQNKPEAIKRMQELADLGVFRTSAQSITQDVSRLKSRFLQRAGNAYAYIDLPAKYAAYYANRDAGMSPDAAAQHLRDLYQNRDAVPTIIAQISKAGAFDYFGYTYDSARISVNQAKRAVEQARKGNIAPAIGFVASHGISALITSTKLAGYTGALWSTLHRAMARRKDVEDTTQMNPESLHALRDFLPEYYQNAQAIGWMEKKRGGGRELYYTMLSNQSAWPIDDLVIGTMQSAQGGGGWDAVAASLANYGQERVGVGMYPNALFRMLTGETVGGKYQTKGIVDSMRIEDDPERFKIIAESSAKFLADVYGGQPGQMLQQMYDYQAQDDKREKQMRSGAYVTSRTLADIAWGKAALIRTYRVTKGDMERMLKMHLRDAAETAAEAKRLGNERARIKAVDRAIGTMGNGKLLSGDWFNQIELIAMAQDAGFSKDEATAIYNENRSALPPYQAKENKTALERARTGSSDANVPSVPTAASIKSAIERGIKQ